MSKSPKSLMWSAWGIVTFFYAYQYILRVMPSILMEDIVEKFSLTPAAFGQFSGVYYLGYSLMHLPLGIIIDRFGPKKILPILIACTSLGLLPIIYADSFIYPVLGRALIGIGSSGAVLGLFKVLHLHFEPTKFSRFLSFSVTIGLCGAIYGGTPLMLARKSFGFQQVVFVLILVSLILSVVTYLVLPASESKKTNPSEIFDKLKELFTNTKLLMLCCIAGFMVGPLEGFADVWGVQFLKIFHGLSDNVAAGVPSWIFIGMGIGGPLLSFIAERGQRYIQVVFASACIMAAAFVLLLTFKLSAPVLCVLFFFVGVCSAYQMLMLYYVSTLVREPLRNLSSVVANMLIMIFGYVFHTSIGKFIGWISHTQNLDGFQDSASLAAGISIIPAALLVSVVVLSVYLLRLKMNKPVA